MNRVQLKQDAKQKIKGKIGILFLISLIMGVCSFLAGLLLSFIPFVGPIAVVIIVTPAFTLTTYTVYLTVVSGEKPSAGDSFSGFKDFWSAFKLTFLVGFFTFLWTLLFIIPGIIKTYSYSMSMFVLAEKKGTPALECIAASKKMTEGKKMDLFVLELSFLGWILLCGITLGIASIWVVPYFWATKANVYNAIKPATENNYVSAEPSQTF